MYIYNTWNNGRHIGLVNNSCCIHGWNASLYTSMYIGSVEVNGPTWIDAPRKCYSQSAVFAELPWKISTMASSAGYPCAIFHHYTQGTCQKMALRWTGFCWGLSQHVRIHGELRFSPTFCLIHFGGCLNVEVEWLLSQIKVLIDKNIQMRFFFTQILSLPPSSTRPFTWFVLQEGVSITTAPLSHTSLYSEACLYALETWLCRLQSF